MHIDLKKDKKQFKNKFLKIRNLYDYIIIGSGPASAIITNNLLKKKKRFLVLERGSYQKNFIKKISSDKFKIANDSRIFGIGGTSNTWSHIYSLMSQNEMLNNNSKNIWPLTHEKLKFWCNKVALKYNFKVSNINTKKIYKNKFYLRKFIENKNPTRFAKYFKNNKIDIITNCKAEYVDEYKKKALVNFYIDKKKYSINTKKVIICAGAIESCSIVKKSIEKKELKYFKNRKYIGRYFMEHPKCYVGVIKYPNREIIDKFKVKTKKRENSYIGLSLYEKNVRTLNTYVRFEESKSLFTLKNKFLVKIFFEMEPSYKNRIYFKKNKINIILKMNKNEINSGKKLLAEVKNEFSLKPELENLELITNNLLDASHHMGGLCYPKIVDKNLKIRGFSNVYCCSSAIFPTSGSVNPTLIICGLAERLSYYLN